jgi:lipoate-protein ligase A
MWIDDEILRNCHLPYYYKYWCPQETVVVAGSSNVIETEVDEARCMEDNVRIYRRYGGGGSVVLHHDCFVLSFGGWVKHEFRNKYYFELLNQVIIETLSPLFGKEEILGQAGISDIVYGEKKIAGTSLFRSRHYLLYQASVLLRPQLDVIARYLKHPSKEPDYRRKRSHKDFLLGIYDINPTLDHGKVLAAFDQNFLTNLLNYLKDELREPDMDYLPNLLKRAEVGNEI